MGSELVPAVVAAAGGGALVTAIGVYEYRRERAMRASRQTFALTFPLATDPEAAVAALGALSGLPHDLELIAEVAADEHGIRHRLHVPDAVAHSVRGQLTAAIPGLRLETAAGSPAGVVTHSVRIGVPVRALLRTDDPVRFGRALLSELATLRSGEWVSVRWALRPASPPVLPDQTSPPASLRERSELQALRARQGQPGFRVAGLILTGGPNRERARQITRHVVAVLRSRRGVGSGLMVRTGSVREATVMPHTVRVRGWLSTRELLACLAWPLGSELAPGVELGAARQLTAGRQVPRTGRRLLIASGSEGERPVALTPEAARHHLAVVGPTGTGKSSLIGRCILSDLADGFGGVVVDPKGDLAGDLLDRIPAEHAKRVVVLDPAAPGPVPGLNLLGVGDPDLRSDVVLGALAGIYRDGWGIRSAHYFGVGLRTLAQLPEPTLLGWPRLFSDAGFRRQAVSRLRDPVLLAAWQTFEALSPAEQYQHVAAPMTRLTGLLMRPAVRAVLAQRQPRLDLGRLLDEGKWLVVSLAPGTLGEPAAQLLGAVVTYLIWTVVEARVAIPPQARRPLFFYFDELQSLSALPVGLELFFERTRGLGCGVTVATQALGRLPEAVRTALLGNVGSLIAFRANADEAARIARELPGLAAQDVQGLRRFEVGARISLGVGNAVTTVTGHTEPLPARTGQADRIRALSAERYGRDPRAVEDELRVQTEPGAGLSAEPSLGRTRRAR